MNDADDVVKEFLVESYENLHQLDRELVELEKHPSDEEVLGSVLRTIHTIKGTSGFLRFSKLEAVTHVGENLLSRLGEGQLLLNPEIATALRAMVDAIRQILSRIEAQGTEGDGDHTALIANLTKLLRTGKEPAAAASTGGKIHREGGRKESGKGGGQGASPCSSRVGNGPACR